MPSNVPGYNQGPWYKRMYDSINAIVSNDRNKLVSAEILSTFKIYTQVQDRPGYIQFQQTLAIPVFFNCSESWKKKIIRKIKPLQIFFTPTPKIEETIKNAFIDSMARNFDQASSLEFDFLQDEHVVSLIHKRSNDFIESKLDNAHFYKRAEFLNQRNSIKAFAASKVVPERMRPSKCGTAFSHRNVMIATVFVATAILVKCLS